MVSKYVVTVFMLDSEICLDKKYLKKISDVVTLGTFCDRDQSFINRRGVGYFFHGRRATEPDPPPHTQSK